jgi:hypothetical protein
VPRAFTCDYSPVADILTGWGASFRAHGCLQGGTGGRKAHGARTPGCGRGGGGGGGNGGGGGARKVHLYAPIGRALVLQPDAEWSSFVGPGDGDGDHPLLPRGPGMYALEDPQEEPQRLRATAAAPATFSGHAAGAGVLMPPGARGGAAPCGAGAAAGAAAGGDAQQRQRRVVPSARDALLELMDWPHPLETLADPSAYSSSGSISRYHNPDHYTAAAGRIIALWARGAGPGTQQQQQQKQQQQQAQQQQQQQQAQQAHQA